MWLLGVSLAAGCGARSDLEVAVDGGEVEDRGRPMRDVGPADRGPADRGAVDLGPPDLGPPPCLDVERCNGLDDDCDGRVDEDLALLPVGSLQTLREDEFDTGNLARCSSCAWALDSQLVPTTSGALYLFTIGILGGSEMPSLFGRDLDADGTPRGPVRRLDDRAVPLQIAAMPISPRIEGEAVLDARLRISRDDLPGLVFVSETCETRIVTAEVPSPSRRRAMSAVTDDGRVVTFSWASVTFPERIDVSVLDRNGHRIGVGDPIEAPGLRSTVSIARRPTDDGPVLGVLWETFDRETRVRERFLERYDASGRAIGRTPVPLERERSVALAGTADGWVVVQYSGSSARDGSERLALDADGVPVGEPIPVWGEDEENTAPPAVRAAIEGHRRLLATVAGRVEDGVVIARVALWGSNGALRASVDLPIPPDERYPDELTSRLWDPALLWREDRGDLLLAWQLGSDDGVPNRVHLQRFVCGGR